MKLDNNTVYYFFSTSAQVYSAILAIILTLLLFKIQRLIDKYKEESRTTLEKFIEPSIENDNMRFIRSKIDWKKYWSFRKDSERIQHIKDNIFSQTYLTESARFPGIPRDVDPQFFTTLKMHIADLNSLSHKTELTRKNTIYIFVFGTFLICTAVACLLTPDMSLHACSVLSLVLGHLLLGVFFFIGMYSILRGSTDLKEL